MTRMRPVRSWGLRLEVAQAHLPRGRDDPEVRLRERSLQEGRGLVEHEDAPTRAPAKGGRPGRVQAEEVREDALDDCLRLCFESAVTSSPPRPS